MTLDNRSGALFALLDLRLRLAEPAQVLRAGGPLGAQGGKGSSFAFPPISATL